MAIIGLVLTPIFGIQLAVLRGNARASQLLARILLAKQMLVDAEFQLSPTDSDKRIEKKIANPPTTLMYELKRAPETSALKKFNNLFFETVTIQWQERGKKRQDRLLTFAFRPEVK